MAKHPDAGRVKTRLASAIGGDAAAALARAFVDDLAGRLHALPYHVTWAYWPPEAPFATLVPGRRCRPQRGADLGERMASAIADELADGAGVVLVIGADTPHVPAAALAEAEGALHRQADLVLGPAPDGGYYLIGVRASAPALFADVAWGTAAVLAETRARAQRLGLRTHLLPPCFDVDELEDLERLRGLIARGETVLPATAAVLARVLPLARA